MISAGKVQLFIVKPPGAVNVHAANAVFIISFSVEEIRNNSTHISTGGIMKVSSNRITVIGETVRMPGGFGIQQKSCAFAGTCSQNNRATIHLVFLHILFIDIGNSGSQSFLIS